MRDFFSKLLRVWLALTTVCAATTALAQQPRIQFPAGSVPSGTSAPLVPVQPFPGAPTTLGNVPGGVLGTPTFDPYAPASNAPTLFGAPTANPYGVPPSTFGSPTLGTPYGAPPYNPAFPTYRGVTPNPYPGQNPNSLFPNGINFWPNSPQAGGQGEPLRLFENLRLRHAWLPGDGGREVDINDTEIGTTLQMPNFLWTGQPFQLSPGFGLHLWDGPEPPFLADLPARAYSAFLEAHVSSEVAATFGGDLTVNVGVYSDFNALTTHSLRIQGFGYGWVRLTPNLMFKIGANYIDRVDLKLLPVVGLYWEPNPQTRLDMTFPKAKLARYVATLGNTDFWMYVGAEYGGGSWTIEHVGGLSDQVDINDIRIYLGTEWTCQSGLKGFAEIGYVTNRELVYRIVPADNLRLSDTLMVRAGFSW